MQPDKDVLLVEYETCMIDMSQLDSDIWQSSSIFLGLSILGFSLLISTQSQNWTDFAVYIIFSIFGLILLIIWHKLVGSWLRLIHINLHRMREIELELGMHRERLIEFLDEGSGMNAKDDAAMFAMLRDQFPGKRLGGPPGTRRIIKWLVAFIASGWIVLIIKQLTFSLFFQGD